MSDFKLNSIISQDPKEPADLSFLGDERDNAVYKILDHIRNQNNGFISNISKNVERRGLSDRFFRQNPAASLLAGRDEKREHRSGLSGRRSGAFLSGAAYCVSSCSMILSTCFFYIFYAFFFFSLKYINIAMVTILKNMTNILTALGEIYMFQKRQNQKVWTAMFMMIISAISGGATDLSFDATGYAWQITNCVLTALYSLTLRKVMDKAKQLTKSGSLNEISMVLLNNLLSLPLAIFLILLFGELDYVISLEVIRLPMFWIVATASGLLGLAISFTSMWFLHQTGPTTYSLVGSLNKVPISIAGLVLFKVPLSLPNMFSILFGLLAGMLFARAKM
ncbi:GDP-mannose transporter GONST2-like [Carica papaya]|uniref:GDP-mannose transporter GONST2-like n=1 Tax=Carica papaya TaxID=3649 RepID=UPI000B8CD62B|nr:GDP-mannose transporter GONST2-like [Carica papaya]